MLLIVGVCCFVQTSLIVFRKKFTLIITNKLKIHQNVFQILKIISSTSRRSIDSKRLLTDYTHLLSVGKGRKEIDE
jgi:hypothetical protein